MQERRISRTQIFILRATINVLDGQHYDLTSQCDYELRPEDVISLIDSSYAFFS